MCVCIYTYISRLYVYIYRFARVPCPLFTERFAFPPSRPNLGAVFPRCVFLFVPSFSPPASIPFVITEDESRVIGTRSFRVTIPLPPSPIHPSRFTTGIAFRFSFRTSLLKYA